MNCIYIYRERETYKNICLLSASLAEKLLVQTPIEDSGSYSVVFFMKTEETSINA